MKKILFFDVDGTLVGRDGTVPESARVAIRKARENGHLAFICTGRSKPEILPDIRNVGFDGVVGAGGAYIEIGEEVVLHETLPEEVVHRLLALFHSQNIGYYLETNDGLFASDNLIDSMVREITKDLPDTPAVKEAAMGEMQWFIDLLKEIKVDEFDYALINKICFINADYPYETIDKEFGELLNMHRSTIPQYGRNSGEAGVKGLDKEAAVTFVLEKLALSKESAIAFGDGDNDLSMFAAVGYSVAMANGSDALKAAASEVTDTPEENGIAKALEKLGLI